MNCLHCSKYIYSYYDSELSAQTRLEIERHLAECPACRFQYDLTMTENKVLRDTSDIPELSQDFNQRVLQAISADKTPPLPDNVIVMAKDRRYRFKRSYLLIVSTVACMLLAFYVYAPGLFTGGEKQVAQSGQVTNVQISEPMKKMSGTGAAPENMKESQIQMDAVGNSSYGNLSEVRIYAADENPKLADASRMTINEAGRADRATSETLSVSSVAVKNIPEKYKLVSQDNSMENMAAYSYQTVDGSQTINIQLSVPEDTVIYIDTPAPKAAPPLTCMAAPAEEAQPVNISRKIEIDGQTILLELSGNVNNDELNSLADQIVLSKTP